MKTIRRDWLRKQIEAGKVVGKCDMHLTDDYAWDNASGFGKTGWMPVRIRHPKFTRIVLPNGNDREHCSDSDCLDGYLNFDECYFGFKSGHASWNDDGTIRFRVHSNLWYTLQVNA